MKPKDLAHPLVARCSIGHKPCPSILVDRIEVKLKTGVHNRSFFPKWLCLSFDVDPIKLMYAKIVRIGIPTFPYPMVCLFQKKKYKQHRPWFQMTSLAQCAYNLPTVRGSGVSLSMIYTVYDIDVNETFYSDFFSGYIASLSPSPLLLPPIPFQYPFGYYLFSIFSEVRFYLP